MPLYEYRCNTCGEAFEKMVRFSEMDRAPTCPKCASFDTQKKISTIASFGSASLGTSSASGGSCGSSGGFS